MLKRLFLVLALIVSSILPAFAAGSISLSLSQQFNSLGRPLNGGKLYFYVAGTTATPQSAYQDTALTIAYPNPITLDAAGRVPAFYLADGSIKIRLTDSAGVTQVVADNVLVIGASSGGGGGSSVDATTILATGDFKLVYNTGNLTGFVRCNGRTIGNATSGATERANADTSALFVALYTADTNLSVSGGRGASAAADYAANKALTLPDCKSRTLAGLSDMGGTDSGRLTTTYFGCTGLVLGCAGGAESTTLTAAQIPSITSTVSVTSASSGIVAATIASTNFTFGNSGSTQAGSLLGVGAVAVTATSTGTGTSNNTSGSAHRTVQPTILVTIYIKL